MDNVLSQFRAQTGIGRRELADKLGISPVHVWRLENGTRDYSPEMAIKIEETLGIPRWKSRPDLWSEPTPSPAPPERSGVAA